MNTTDTFLNDLLGLILRIPTNRFGLKDIYARQSVLVAAGHSAKELEAQIRDGLQALRDYGLIQFLDNRGTYEKGEGI